MRKLYTERWSTRGDISVEEAEQALEDFQARLQEALEQTRSVAAPQDIVRGRPAASPSACCPRIETGVDRADARAASTT